MTRRIIAFAAFLVVLALALTLLYRVYVHHTQAEPLVDDDRAVVRGDPNPASVKIATVLR